MTQTAARFSAAPPEPIAQADRRPGRNNRGASPASAYLKQFHELAAMIGLMNRLPDLADDIGRWRPDRPAKSFGEAAQWRKDEILRVFDGLNPLMSRAFEAVAAGLAELAQSAVDLCNHGRRPLTAGEHEACAAIGRAMRRLLERAAALVESADGRRRVALMANRPEISGDRRVGSVASSANAAN